jgi:hypothetical protein
MRRIGVACLAVAACSRPSSSAPLVVESGVAAEVASPPVPQRDIAARKDASVDNDLRPPRIDESPEQARTALLYTLPLALAEPGTTTAHPNGSGVLLRVGAHWLIATAGHCIDRFPLAHGVTQLVLFLGRMPTQVSAVKVYRSKQFDTGALEIGATTAAALMKGGQGYWPPERSGDQFLPLSSIAIDDDGDGHLIGAVRYFVLGFPGVLARDTTFQPLAVWGAPFAIGASNSVPDPSSLIAIPMPQRGSRIPSRDLHGMSGGGMWRVGNDGSLRLVGAMIWEQADLDAGADWRDTAMALRVGVLLKLLVDEASLRPSILAVFPGLASWDAGQPPPPRARSDSH